MDQLTQELILHEVRNLRSDVARLLGRRLNKQEMAEYLGISPPTLNKWIAQGKVPRPGLGGRWLLADVQEWEAGR